MKALTPEGVRIPEGSGPGARLGMSSPQKASVPAPDGTRRPNRVIRMLFLLYRGGLRPMLGSGCRYEPSCSVFAEEAIARYGMGRGVFLGLRRVLRCHPFRPGGFDPVP